MTPAGGGWLAELLIEWHHPSAYFLAVAFPGWRWLRRRNGMTLGMVIHQAATGFTVPAFVLLCFTYLKNDLATHLSPHEMGVAGLFALLTSLRELFVDGKDDDGHSRF